MLSAPWLAWLAPDRAPGTDEARRTDWARVVAQAEDHAMSAALHRRLRDSGLWSTLPPAAAATLAERHAAAGFDVLVWRRALSMLLPALAAEGILPIPYKGAALAFLAYAEPAMRPMSDLDLWIEAADMPRACAVLERLGFQRRDHVDRPVALQARHDGEIPYAGHRIGVPLVELHWGVFPGEWLHRTAVIDRDELRQRCRPATLLGHPVRILAPEDQFIQVAIHAGVTHVFSQAAVRCLLDLVVIAHHGLHWELVLERARAWRLSRVVAHALALAGDLFDRPEFATAAERLVGRRGVARLYRRIDPDALLARRRFDAGLPKWRYLVAAVDDPRARLRLLSRSLWPEPEWLAARYGQADLRTRAAHLAGAVRGRF
jgi:hypothetical protein